MNQKIKNQTTIVTAKQMQKIEADVFAHHMPVASLMEKAALLTSQKIKELYPYYQYPVMGIFIGCGHNGGDGLVIARELWLTGYEIYIYAPLAHKSKDLTAQHLNYAQFLGINFVEKVEDLKPSDVIIDGLFGFGLTRSISGELADNINTINQWRKPVISIDIPSGINTDTGKVLGTAIKAKDTFCLGLWKLGLWQDLAVEYVGNLHLIDIGIPSQSITQYLSDNSPVTLMNDAQIPQLIPLPRPVNTHKYRQGNALIIAGSEQYAGAALLSGYGATNGGVGMLTMMVPKSIKFLINSNLPSALVIGVEENEAGAINDISLDNSKLSKYDVIALGMGISRHVSPSFRDNFQQILTSNKTLLIDADGLNLLVEDNLLSLLSQREGSTILTPHAGEFRRLFPQLDLQENRLQCLQRASAQTNSIILLKGAKTMICDRGKQTWIIEKNTPALARGGSGDVLSGFITSLVAQGDFSSHTVAEIVATGAWLHQQAAILAVQEVSEMGVEGVTLAEYLKKALVEATSMA